MPRLAKDDRKRVFIDLETNGLEPSKGAIILQIGALTDNEDDPVFYDTVLPTNEQYARSSPEAIKVNGLTWEVLQEKGRPWQDVKDDFVRWLDQIVIHECVFVGQNPAFDMKFLRYHVPEVEFLGAPVANPIDIRNMYSTAVRKGLVNPVESGRTGHVISRSLGVEEESEVHDALGGAEVVKRNYDKLQELLKQKQVRLG